MIYNIKLSTLEERTSTVIDYIKNQRDLNTNYCVIDVGGSMGGWTYQYVNAIIDLNAPVDNDEIKHFSFNINYPDGWKDVEEYVNKNGKFDFCVCSHTLEDISNPKYVCDQITKIAKSGYIAVPSKYSEFSRGVVTPEGKKIRGYVHHRWIFTFKNGKFIGFPKISYVEVDDIFDLLANNDKRIENLGFFWNNEIELHIINNDYLGSSQMDAMNRYRSELFNDDLDLRNKL